MAAPARRPSPRRRSSGLLAATASLAVLAGAGAGAWLVATAAADEIERRATAGVRAALDVAGLDWARVASDGLQVALTGVAPDEITRFRAVEQAGTVVDPRRVMDRIEVELPDEATPPAFSVELLRNDAGISLIGLVPATTDRRALVERLRRAAAGDGEVTDLLESADYPAPKGWDEAMAFGAEAAALSPRAKVSIAAGRVSVTAITDSREDKARLEDALRRGKPDPVALLTQISAPRPVVSPFTLRFVLDADGARFDACTADTESARDRILTAAAAAGVEGRPGCTLGLGAPTPQWADAAAPGIAAVGALGRGTLTMSDADISLHAPLGVSQAAFDEQVGRLEAALPDVFTLEAVLDKPSEPAPPPAEFSATRAEDGLVTLRGRITDERMREAVESLARARFQRVDSALRLDPQVPEGWTVRVIAALEAMAGLEEGEVTVTADEVRIEGVSGVETASDAAAAALGERLGAGARYELAIRYDPRLDRILALPDGETCAGDANAVLATAEIGFAPSSARIDGDIAPTLAALAEALENCGDYRIEVGGHTDSQGSEDFNATLSQERADAVLAAMAEAGIDTAAMTAAGYGESRPVESNETPAGRDANRRIEFRLVTPEPVMVQQLAPASVVSGVTTGGTANPSPGAIRGTERLGRFDGAAAVTDAATGMLDLSATAGNDEADADIAGVLLPDDREAAPALPTLAPGPGALVGADGRPAASGGGTARGGSLWSGDLGGDLRIETVAPPALTGEVPHDGPVAPGDDEGYTEPDRPNPRPDL